MDKKFLKSKRQNLIAARRAKVAWYALRQYKLVQIAEEVGVTAPTVCQDLKAIREEWRQSAQRDIGEHMNEQYEMLREAQHEAWKQGDIDLVLKSHDRIAKLLGTNAPERREYKGLENAQTQVNILEVTEEDVDRALQVVGRYHKAIEDQSGSGDDNGGSAKS